MAAISNSHLVSLFRFFTQVAGNIVIFIGCIILIGWLFNIPILKDIIPGTPKMMPNTAIAFVFAGIALRYKGRIAHAGAIIVIAVGILTLSQYIFGIDLKIDQLLFADSKTPQTSYPGRMSPHSAVGFILGGIALLLAGAKRTRISQLLVVFLILTLLLALIGYAYSIKSLYSISPYIGMSPITAILFLILCLGILLSQPDKGFMAVVSSDTSGGFMARRLLPAAAIIPLALGYIRLKGEHAGLYDTEFGLMLFAISNVIIFIAIIWWYARSLDRADIERKEADDLLRITNRSLMVLSECNEALVRIRNESELLHTVCRIIVEHRASKRHRDYTPCRG
ncbi:MAG: hypothetical protein HZA05_02470 [Nitrospirae bacterium]|nr:hypothetical protein [Nitrospirota bacterium]